MGISAGDVIPRSHVRSNFSELAEEVKAGAEKIVTKTEENFIALIDEVSKGLDDVAAGRVKDARNALQRIRGRRSTSALFPVSSPNLRCNYS
jgi:antitoxin (DNA-binding transcriptional repressor) of toxin-antitoxin stability system